MGAGVAVAGAGGTAYWLWKSRTPDARGSAAAQTAGQPGGGKGKQRDGGAKGAQPVSVQAVRRQNIRVTVNAIGSIAALNTATVHAQVSGVLQRLNFKEGQQAKAGESLALIDPRVYEASLGQAEGALARDKAQLDNARIDLKRYRDLIVTDAVPKQQLDTLRRWCASSRAPSIRPAAVDTARLQLSYTRVSAPIAGRVA